MTTAVCCKSYNQKISLFVNPFNYFLCVVHTVTIQKADIQIHTGFIWPFTCLVLKWLLSHVTCPSCCVFPPPFSSCAREAHVRRMKKKVCWSAIGSDSQKLVAHLDFCYFSSCVLHEPLVHMMKKVLFSSFWTMQTHAQAGQNTQQWEFSFVMIHKFGS